MHVNTKYIPRGYTSGGVDVPCLCTHCRQLMSLLLYLCYIFQALVNSLVCWYFIWKYSRFSQFSPEHCMYRYTAGCKRTNHITPLSRTLVVIEMASRFFHLQVWQKHTQLTHTNPLHHDTVSAIQSVTVTDWLVLGEFSTSISNLLCRRLVNVWRVFHQSVWSLHGCWVLPLKTETHDVQYILPNKCKEQA